MQRARQTPHGARPNREEVRGLGRGHVPARCVKPSGRSLEPRSDARPRGMTVQQEQSRGQNSAYRSGCHKFLFSITYRTPDPDVTQLTGVGRKRRLRWLKGRLVHEIGKRGQPRSPYRCNFRERSTETLDPSQWKEHATFAYVLPPSAPVSLAERDVICSPGAKKNHFLRLARHSRLSV
jgi:hypothetical protein